MRRLGPGAVLLIPVGGSGLPSRLRPAWRR